MFHLTDTRLRTPCEMPYQREHLTVNQGVTGSSPVGGANLAPKMVVFGAFFSQKAKFVASDSRIFMFYSHTPEPNRRMTVNRKNIRKNGKSHAAY